MPSQDAQKQKDISRQIGQPLSFDLGRDSKNRGNDNGDEKKSASLKKDKQKDSSGGASLSQNLKKGKHSAKSQSRSKRAKEGLKKKLNVAKQGTAQLLCLSWEYFYFVLPLIYTNIHAFFRLIFPQVFCKLGEEWSMKKPSSDPSSKKAQSVLTVVEPIALALLDLIILLIILGIAYQWQLLFEIISNPLDYYKMLGEEVVNMITGIF